MTALIRARRGHVNLEGDVGLRQLPFTFPSCVTTPHVSEAVTGSVRARSRSIVARPARGTAPRALRTGRIGGRGALGARPPNRPTDRVLSIGNWAQKCEPGWQMGMGNGWRPAVGWAGGGAMMVCYSMLAAAINHDAGCRVPGGRVLVLVLVERRREGGPG